MLRRMLSRWFGRTPRATGPGWSAWRDYRAGRNDRTIAERIEALRAFALDGGAPPAAAAELAKLSFDCLGPTPPVIRDLRRLAEARGRDTDPDADRVRAHLASALAEISDCAEAADVMWPIVDRTGATAYDLASIALMEHMHLTGMDDGRTAAECRAFMAAQPAHQAAFERLLADRSVSIAVVGNSPVELGRGLGAEIAAKDVVIRFNNYSDALEHEADYGRRTDVWARAATHTTVWRRPAQAYDFVLFTGVDRRFHGPKFWDVLEAARSGARAVFVPTRVYVELTARLKFPPSGGMQLLWWLRRLRGPFADGNVHAYGFSMDDQEPNRSTHYFADHTARPSYWHHWPAEGAFLRSEILG